MARNQALPVRAPGRVARPWSGRQWFRSQSTLHDWCVSPGEAACPVPDFVVVHFPEYKGPACFGNLPKTWVPIPCVEVRHRTLLSVSRASVPLRLAWALTIHKSQGITAHEGCIVSFDGCRGSASVGKLGLAFVAWTRATNWHLMAFHKLPPRRLPFRALDPRVLRQSRFRAESRRHVCRAAETTWHFS